MDTNPYYDEKQQNYYEGLNPYLLNKIDVSYHHVWLFNCGMRTGMVVRYTVCSLIPLLLRVFLENSGAGGLWQVI